MNRLSGLPNATQGMLSTLGREDVEMIRQASLQRRASWLCKSLDDGVFDWSGDPIEALERLTAATYFLSGTTLQTFTVDPQFGPLKHPVVGLHLEADDNFKQFFCRLVPHLLAQPQGPVTRLTGPEPFALPQTMARLLVALIALDLPEQVAKVAVAHPYAMQAGVDPQLIGQANQDFCRITAAPIRFKPYLLALQYSRTACMNALAAAGSDTESIAIDRGGPSLNAYSMQRCSRILGLPSSFAHALSQCKPKPAPGPGPEPSDLNQLIEGSFSIPWPDNSPAHYRVALQAAGVYEIDPALTIKLACENGQASVIEGLQSEIDWTTLTPQSGGDNRDHFLIKTLRRCANNRARHEGYEDAILAVLEKSLEDGVYDTVFKPYTGPAPMHSPGVDERQAQPFAALIDNGFARVMVRMVQLGLDPAAPGVDDTLSPLDYADKVGSNVGGAMRSYLAREKARAVMGEMDGENESAEDEIKPVARPPWAVRP